MHRPLIFILCALILAACQLSNGIASQPTPTIDIAAVKTDSAAAYAQLTEVAALPTAAVQTAIATLHTAVAATLSSQPTKAANVTPTPTVKPTATLLPLPNPMPTLEPAKVPGLLQSSLSVEKLNAFNGHALQKITGWNYGFDSFEWMDANHLLFFPITGQTMVREGTIGFLLQSAVINLGSGGIWLPSYSEMTSWSRKSEHLLRWSAKLRILIVVQTSENNVVIYDPNGNVITFYSGKLLSVSPSGTKILIADDTWIDLSSGKIVDFNWYQNFRGMTPFSIDPIWSPDETRIYTCCYLYGDARTGESFGIPYDDYTIDGKKAEESLYNFLGTWVLGDKYMLSQWGGVWDGSPGFIPLFDPAAKTYRNLNTLTGIRADTDFPGNPGCRWTSAANGGRYIWMDCFSASYLVDLVTFKSQAYPYTFASSVEWSANGQFALVSGEDTNQKSFVRVLSVSNKELKPLPDNHYCPWWHPTNDVLACQSKDAKTLSLLNVQTMSVQQGTTLPVEVQTVIWSPDGKHMVLLARDSSLWQIDYPTLENLEQLTPAMPKLTHPAYGRNIDESLIKNVAWSPDGASLAFIGGTDIYIVDTQVKP